MSDEELAGSGDLFSARSAAQQDESAEHSRLRRARDEEFSAFYRDTVRKLIAFLVSQGAALSDAADLAQTTMIKAYRRWEDLEHHRAWVYTVASRDLIRKLSEAREDLVEEVPEPTSLLPRPDAVTDWECRHDALSVLRQLPARQRQVMAWTLSDFTPSEIAEQLGMTPEAVRASLKKARRAATECVRKWEEGQ